MARTEPRVLGRTMGRTADAAAIDEGLRAYMLRVYNYMALGVAVAAISTLVVMNSPAVLETVFALKWVLFIAVLGLGFFSPRLILTGNTAMAHGAYWTYSVLWGLLIAPMIFAFFQTGAGDLVFRAFLVASVTFGGASLFGYTTRRDMSGLSGFFIMAVIGLLVAMLVNAFIFESSMMSLIVSSLVVIVFSGITAWETQEIKQMYYAGDGSGVATGKAIFGAFLLFGSFITIFIHLLNIFGILSSND